MDNTSLIDKINHFSIVIPIYNEVLNINELVEGIYNSLNLTQFNSYEIIFINDGSTDNTDDFFKKQKLLLKLKDQKILKLLENNLNLGQSFSISKGIKESKYNTIVTLDGDGQNNPKDISKLLEIYFSHEDIKLVGGIRKKRKDSYIKILSSKIANSVRSYVLNDGCSDTGCSLKVFDKEVFEILPYFDGIHRFLPALYKGYGNKTMFVDVDHRPRTRGISKYGTFGRLFRGIIDLIRVKIIINQYRRC